MPREYFRGLQNGAPDAPSVRNRSRLVNAFRFESRFVVSHCGTMGFHVSSMAIVTRFGIALFDLDMAFAHHECNNAWAPFPGMVGLCGPRILFSRCHALSDFIQYPAWAVAETYLFYSIQPGYIGNHDGPTVTGWLRLKIPPVSLPPVFRFEVLFLRPVARNSLS